jgi:hypothetical protein
MHHLPIATNPPDCWRAGGGRATSHCPTDSCIHPLTGLTARRGGTQTAAASRTVSRSPSLWFRCRGSRCSTRTNAHLHQVESPPSAVCPPGRPSEEPLPESGIFGGRREAKATSLGALRDTECHQVVLAGHAMPFREPPQPLRHQPADIFGVNLGKPAHPAASRSSSLRAVARGRPLAKAHGGRISNRTPMFALARRSGSGRSPVGGS